MQMPGHLNLPPRFEKKLRDSGLRNALGKTLETFSWLPSRALDLFPDFTDHGPDHLSQVLGLAEQLVPPSTWSSLTPDDAAIFVLVVLLHDLGMHVTTDGFRTLFTGRSPHRPVEFFDSSQWRVVWETFCIQASRFDSRQNIDLFGSPEPVKVPNLLEEGWTENQRRLAGECLRRNHARLAHEIALYGFPGPQREEPLRIDEGLFPVADLAGVIARSHGTQLRPCVEYLKEYYNDTVTPRNINAAYLMALLRVSDFLQFDPARAPATRLRVQSLRSPVSKREWKKHVIEVAFKGEDPEALYIHCDPQDIETYLGVKSLLSNFQGELDMSAAVLAEVYRDSKLALSRRRVRSNLDARGWRPPNGKYIPVHARFDTNNPELLDCLVAPLYNYDPAYGIRELIQNAVDAVRELKALGHYENDASDWDVRVSLTNDALTVEDRGIGMTADTIENYFLRAGASFRRSDAWRREFADEAGHSRVLRSGRFGVGALASFLIGSKLKVSSRHWSQPKGIFFEASLYDDPIELRPYDRSVGTTINIPVQSAQYLCLRFPDSDRLSGDNLPFHWFRFKWPRVQIILDSTRLTVRPYLSDGASAQNRGWVQSEIEGVPAQWCRTGMGIPLVNGFEVRENNVGFGKSSPYYEVLDKGAGQAYRSWVSFWDADGKLQIDLKRTTLRRPSAPASSSGPMPRTG